MGCRVPSRSGFTLLELTAVVVLMGIVAAAVVPGFARRSDETVRRKLVAELIDLDARARLNASSSDACFLAMERTTNRILLTVIRTDESTVLDQVEIPDGILVALLSDENAVGFDQSGHTDPYGYEISAGNRVTRIRFHGLTGWYEIEFGGDE